MQPLTFSGKCQARDLSAQMARRHAQAAYIRRWHQLHPDAPQRAERSLDRMLLAMSLVLLLAFALHWYNNH